jgi:hypothetical protein
MPFVSPIWRREKPHDLIEDTLVDLCAAHATLLSAAAMSALGRSGYFQPGALAFLRKH